VSEDLLLYAQLGRADHIKRLVREGVDPDWRREDGVTTLMMAAMTGRLEVIESLIDSGATIDLQTPDGTTALLAACAYAKTTRDTGAIELLLRRGADPTVANVEGNDPLMVCARQGLGEAVLTLLRAGADPLRANRHGTTALMQAARGHLVDTVRLLIRAGANRSQLDGQGRSALRYADEVGPPPAELAVILAPSDFGSLELSRRVTRFEKRDFKISLVGSWTENESSPSEDEHAFLEVTGERQIHVWVKRAATVDPSDWSEVIARTVNDSMTAILEESADCRFSGVRFFEAGEVTQARWSGSSPSGSFFVASCVYATPGRLVTLAYRDYRPNLSDESRGRQAGESVASFRVKLA
jgi:ankyrin repeat protein